MLRVAGHKNFVTEVEEEYHELRSMFSRTLHEAIERQLAAYRDAVTGYGPPEGTTDRLRDLACELAEGPA